ncbi:hypothetical protein BDP27DRAFT_1469497 [Rhodocollybia butyracea]|uniref:F-box domain-containing protein n=1 Tax=Rhodocollybia butyracea TaxID=206335 RepID=A0A9P5TUG3_9AGAR|nr:hypothetical protein BDP27DRAFT_1469497 [Rhodocollybia butyracea]
MPLCSSYGGNTFAPRVVPDLPGLHNKLRTESGPASVQPDEVASLLQNIQQDLEDYEAQIYPLERLRQEKEHLERYATQLQFLLSPFRKVPDEILRRIFDDCCDTNSFQVFDCDRCDSNSSDSVDLEHSIPTSALTSKPAMVVSSVCSRWRSHALSMPAIWSRISLEWEGDPNEDGYCDDECAEAFSPLSNFLHRSQQHPLTVNLKIEGWPFLKEGVLHPWLAQLFGQISRFRDFSFDCNGTFKELLDSAGISLPSFPVLTRLCIRRSIDKEYLMPFLDTTPNQSLRSQETLDDVHQGFNHLQLSHMDFFPEVADIGNLFDRCLNLSSLRIAVSSWDSRSDLYPTSPSRLEILAVRFRYKDSHDSRSVFPFLRLPSLKSLHLEKPYDDQADEDISGTKLNFKPFMVFVKQSCFQLTTFSIQQLFISDANLVHILIHLPTLQNLTVDDDGIPPNAAPYHHNS